MKEPKPGSDEAVWQGCICAINDNNHGAGIGKPPKYWVTYGCPLHHPKPKKESKE